MIRAATVVAFPGRPQQPRSPARAAGPALVALALLLPASALTAAEKPVDVLIVQVVAPGQTLSRTERPAYEEVTPNRYPAVLIRKMYDPNVEVVKAGDQFLDAAARPPQRGQAVAGLPPGELAFYHFALAREVGLCQ